MISPDARLAEFTAAARVDALPPAVVGFARRLLLDAIASAFAGHRTEERPAVEALAGRLFGPGGATVIAGTPLAPGGAALLNAFKVTAATVCDVHRATLTHVTPEVVPAALAAAEQADATGADLLAALVAGFEVTVRVAEALDGDAYRARGWHNPGVCGPIGAAAAVARLHRLDPAGAAAAMGHAASQAAGTFAALGTSGVKLHQARGALSGLLAGSLAVAGLDAAAEPLTAARGGLLAAYADGGAPERLADGLGDRFAFTSIALRRWPAASSLQSVIAATLEAMADVDAGEVVRARVDLPRRAHLLNATSGWRDQLSALQSARWIVAVVLRDGDCWVDQTSPARLADSLVAGFAAERVAVELDERLPLAGARVSLVDAAGRAHVRVVDAPPGDPGAPLGDAQIAAKLGRATEDVGAGHLAAEIARSVATLDGAASVRPLLQLLGGTAGPAGGRTAGG